MNRAQLKTQDFDYLLSDDRIAKYPLTDRNASKLLNYQNGAIQEAVFSQLDHFLPPNATLVFNDTKVIAARLYFQKESGAKIEIFCLEPFESTVEQTLGTTKSCKWQCMVGNLKRFKSDDVLKMKIAGTLLEARQVERRDREVIIEFSWSDNIDFAQILEEAGEIPLPPYLNRPTEAADEETYQTVYAKQDGAVAAPTAGLHFTDRQLHELQNSGHQLANLTLHVGAGTFRVMKSDTLSEHTMHEERIVIKKTTIEQLRRAYGKIIAVGTTSLRSLESIYWLASKMKQSNDVHCDFISQDDAYELSQEMNWEEACQYLLKVMTETNRDALDFHSALYIMPGYDWKSISGLITNFHQPKSTLLALVAAWIGKDWKNVYDYALEHDFRFLSYGDSSLLMK